jgi:hypothetical protein
MVKPARPSVRRRNPPNHREGRKGGLVRVEARLDAAQVAALEREARRRAGGGGRRADVSEIIGEALAVWMAIRPGQRAIIRAVAARQDLTRPEVLRKALDAWITSLEPGDG